MSFFCRLQSMVVTRLGDLTEHAQSLVEVENKLDKGLAPTLHQLTEERTAAIWDQTLRPKNAAPSHAQPQVQCSLYIIQRTSAPKILA